MPELIDPTAPVAPIDIAAGLLAPALTPAQWELVWRTIEGWYCDAWLAHTENPATAENLRIELRAIGLVRQAINTALGGDVTRGEA